MRTIEKIKSLTVPFLIITLFLSCEKDALDVPVSKKSIKGCVQKGPFINGSSVSVYDLQTDLSPTGKTFNSQILDNNGIFELKNIALSSDYITLRADGFYFNEVSGQQSGAQITLYALSDISDKSDININILTHLEKARVEYLIADGKTFTEAKAQAEKEILAIFNIEKQNVKPFENLNINKSGEDDGILLAISSIMQGYRSESELTELFSNISNDIREDGILNSAALGSSLITHSIYLDTAMIAANLKKRYAEIGTTAEVPDCGKFISGFISKSEFKVSGSLINYPETGLYGSNILSLNDTIIKGSNCSLAAVIPENLSLTVVITALTGGTWAITSGTEQNWYIDKFTGSTRTYRAINSGTSCDLSLVLISPGKYLIEYYETSSPTPTRKKVITFE